MAYKNGVPQHSLARSFYGAELVELCAYQELEWERHDKNDYRFAMLANLIALVNADKKHRKSIKFAQFLMQWGGNKNNREEMDKMPPAERERFSRGCWDLMAKIGGWREVKQIEGGK